MLENDHVIEGGEQVLAGVVPTGPSGVRLNSSYAQRHDDRYRQELGLTLIEIARRVPAGLLVFFPSYPVMESIIQQWQRTDIWTRLNTQKPCVQEPRARQDLNACLANYDRLIATKGSACLLAVCRGKVSEGLDFADDRARCVVITGIPYPPLKDPKVILKRTFLDEQAQRRKSSLTGDLWYGQQASRAVNQAIGRVIRHAKDYGAILFLDERFADERMRSQLSKWLRPWLRTWAGWSEASTDLDRFFIAQQKKVAVPMQNLWLPPVKPPTLTEIQSSFRIDKPVTTVSRTEAVKPNLSLLLNKPNCSMESAKIYLELIKERLTESNRRAFNGILRRYRAREIAVERVTEELLEVLRGHDDLLMDFSQFVSQKHRPAYLERINLHLAEQKPKPAPEVPKEVELMCPICREECKKPFRARCGHICCFACWTSWLEKCLECPMCRQRCRQSQLTKIYQ